MGSIVVRVAAVAAIAGAVAAGANAAVIVDNGDFETVDSRTGLTLGDSDGDVLSSLAGGTGNRSWDVYASLPGGWNAPRGGGIEVQTNNTLTTVDAHSGQHYIELDTETEGGSNSNSMMEQALGVLTSGKYMLSFWYRPRTGNTATNGIHVEVKNGEVLAQNVVNSTTSSWTQFLMPFTVKPGTTALTLRFEARGTADEIGGFIDTVSIAAVPVPAAGLLLAGALGGLGLMRRRRKA